MNTTLLIIIITVFVLIDIFFFFFILSKRKKISIHLTEMVVTSWRKIERMKEPFLQILEADKLLDRILSEKGYRGTLGEKLKQIRGKEKVNVQHVWEFHKKRNEIAHESDIYVSEEERKRLMGYCKEAIRGLGIRIE